MQNDNTPPVVILFSIIALEKFAQTTENKITIQKRLQLEERILPRQKHTHTGHNKNEDNILEELKECENQLKNIKQICIEQHESLQRLLLQVANHKMIHEAQHKQFICPMCCLVISNSTFEEFEQHVVDHFGNYN